VLIVIVLGLVGAIGLYVLLLRCLPRYLHPEAVRWRLQWAHRASVAVVLGAMLVSCSNWDLSIRYPTLFSLLVVGSGLVAGLRTKLGLVFGWAQFLVQMQTALTPVLIPVFFLWVAFSLGDVVYSDTGFSVEVSTSTGWLSDITSTHVTLYQARGVLFDKRIGTIYAAGMNDDASRNFTKKEWWKTVSRVTADVDSLKGVVEHDMGYYAFLISKPWNSSSPQPAPAPAEVLPAEDNKVYTYVEEMPAIPGEPERVLNVAVSHFIGRRLVLLPEAKTGVVLLSLMVDKAGHVRNLRVEKGLDASTDTAVLAAARQLPLFIPGYQNGLPMNISLKVPIQITRKGLMNKALKP